MKEIHRMSRRDFLAITGLTGAGLVLGSALPFRDDTVALAAPDEDAVFTPDIFLQIAPDGTATPETIGGE